MQDILVVAQRSVRQVRSAIEECATGLVVQIRLKLVELLGENKRPKPKISRYRWAKTIELQFTMY